MSGIDSGAPSTHANQLRRATTSVAQVAALVGYESVVDTFDEEFPFAYVSRFRAFARLQLRENAREKKGGLSGRFNFGDTRLVGKRPS